MYHTEDWHKDILQLSATNWGQLGSYESILYTTQGHYSWSQGMGILGDKVQESQEFVTFLPTSLLFICKRGNASLHSAQ
jgi:hypothetical protein